MSAVICLLCDAGQRVGRRHTGDWWSTVAHSTKGWRWTARLAGRGNEKWNRKGIEASWQKRKGWHGRSRWSATLMWEWGWGVFTLSWSWFVSRTLPRWDLVNACVPVRGVSVSTARSQRWLMVYRRMLMGDSSPPDATVSVATWVTCNLSPGSEAAAAGWDAYTPSAVLQASSYISVNCEVILSMPARLCVSGKVWLLCISVGSPPVRPALQSLLASLQLIQMWSERTRQGTSACAITCPSI